jgi:phosphomannomutase
MVLNIVAKLKREGIRFSEKIAQIKHYENSGEINFRIEDKKGAMDAVRDHFLAKEKSTAYMDFDGYRVEFPSWWFNIRPSNTEPYLRFICAAVDPDVLKDRIARTTELLESKFGAVRS